MINENVFLFSKKKKKRIYESDPTIADQAPIHLAIELDKNVTYHKVIVESDAKLCIKALNDSFEDMLWKIRALCNEFKF